MNPEWIPNGPRTDPEQSLGRQNLMPYAINIIQERAHTQDQPHLSYKNDIVCLGTGE